VKARGACVIIKIVENSMAERKKRIDRLQEKMRVLRNLINDGRVSPEKMIELQMEYCYLQREVNLINNRGEA
jgi:SMC interacting uncharacterized protein involved in chromosome segregation